MIKTKADLKKYLDIEQKEARQYTFFKKFFLTNTKFKIWKYLKTLRITEYHYNNRNSIYHRIAAFIYRRSLFSLSQKLLIDIPLNTFEYGLSILHPIIYVAPTVKVGPYAFLVGQNNIGIKSNFKNMKGASIGKSLYLGSGARIIGGVTLRDNICVGANAVVNKSFDESNLLLVGVPAQIKKRNFNVWKQR